MGSMDLGSASGSVGCLLQPIEKGAYRARGKQLFQFVGRCVEQQFVREQFFEQLVAQQFIEQLLAGQLFE